MQSVDVFAALADPTRREIVTLLAEEDRNAGDIAGRFSIAGPSVSRHLRVLRQAGLISYRQRAQTRIYHLEVDALDQAMRWMQTQLDLARERFDRLDTHLERMSERSECDGRG